MRAWHAHATPQAQLAAEPPTRPRKRSWLGPLAGLLLLAATLYYVDQSALRTRLSQLRAAPVLLGAALIFPQLYWLAMRWRLTLQQLGLELSQRRALREYALSFLLNLLLPFGVAGDAIRVVRHARSNPQDPAAGDSPLTDTSGGPGLSGALHGVLLDRLMGQLVVLVWALGTLPLWFGAYGVALCVLGLAALWLAATYLRRLPAPADLSQHSLAMRALVRLSQALKQLLSSPRYLASQLLLSSLLVLSLVAQLYCALTALGLQLSAASATQVFPLMLLSMSVPLSFAGFGPREAVTAELYSILQLSAADGAAFAIAFGAIQVCTSLPCLALVLCLRAEQAP
jgi:uncharacterized membrane protein YbhN (UPF0104 family)